MTARIVGLGWLIFVAGCGMFGSSETADPQPLGPSAPERGSEGSAPPLEGTPADAELTEALGVFVVAGYPDGGDGTRAKPFGTLAKAIQAAKAAGKRVYACEGTFREAVALADGIAMVGGLDCRTMAWALGEGRSRIVAETSPAVAARKITTAARIERFDVVAPDATLPGESSIALLAVDSPGLTIARSTITAGIAAAGAHGADAVQLTQVADPDGKPGAPHGEVCTTEFCRIAGIRRRAGGAGGVSKCAGAVGKDGESGSEGGSGGVWEVFSDGASLRPAWRVYQSDPNRYGATFAAPRTGGVSARGTDGASAQTMGRFTVAGYAPANGLRGTDGVPGRAGQGGAGVEPTVLPPPDADVWYGNDGSGGGAGGCPGLAGGEGQGGGASVAALLVSSPVSFDGVELVARDGGAGGKGSFGSSPTAGGRPGPVIGGHAWTRGGGGGQGGASGTSGSGAGGPSIAIAHSGGAPNLTATTLRVGKPGAGVEQLASTDALGNAKVIPASAAGIAKDSYEF